VKPLAWRQHRDRTGDTSQILELEPAFLAPHWLCNRGHRWFSPPFPHASSPWLVASSLDTKKLAVDRGEVPRFRHRDEASDVFQRERWECETVCERFNDWRSFLIAKEIRPREQ